MRPESSASKVRNVAAVKNRRDLGPTRSAQAAAA